MVTDKSTTSTAICKVPSGEKNAISTKSFKIESEEDKTASALVPIVPEGDKNSIAIGKALAQLQGIEAALKCRVVQDAENRKFKQMWLAVQNLVESVEHGKKAACCMEGRRLPLGPQIKTLKACAGEDTFMNTVISSMPKTTLVKGEYTREDLKTRFEKVYRVGSRVASMDVNGGGISAHLFSWAKSLVTFRINSLDPKQIDPKTATNQELLDGAYKYMQKGDMQQAVKFLSLTYGPTRRMKIMKVKPAGSRASRHTKKYWRKGIDVSNMENVLSDANAPVGSVDATPAEDLFVIDRNPDVTSPPKKYTKRQQAKLDRISRNAVDLDDERDGLPAPKFPSKRDKKRLREPVERKEPTIAKKRKTAINYDLWDTECVPKTTLENNAATEHILRDTRKKLPNKPKSLFMKPSLLPSVALPAAGASYNPTDSDYQDYIGKVVKDELAYLKKEERTARNLKPQVESFVTHEERHLEETEGLVIDPRYGKDDGEIEEQEGKTSETTEKEREPVRKTKKQRAKEAKAKKELIERQKKKARKLNENEVFKAKSINKALEKEQKEQEKTAAERRAKKFVDKMTKRQKLGRGKFEEEDTPFLLEDELTGSLRSLKPQGNILADRLKSMQKRNLLPIGGDRSKAKKTKLRKKFVEKRSVKEVKKGSAVI